MHGIITKNVLNMHPEPSTDSKLSTQGILGQAVEIICEDGDWLHVKTWDSYHAWCLKRWIILDIPSPENPIIVGAQITDALEQPSEGAELITKLVVTSIVEFVRITGPFAEVRLPSGTQAWVQSESAVPCMDLSSCKPEQMRKRIIYTAGRFIGTPYLWGGTTPFGIDCSGFTQLVYRLNGFTLPRDSGLQAADPQSESVDPRDAIQGDLLFFACGEDRSVVTHVGLSCGEDAFIHSAGKGTGVTGGSLSNGHYSEMLVGVRRYVI